MRAPFSKTQPHAAWQKNRFNCYFISSVEGSEYNKWPSFNWVLNMPLMKSICKKSSQRIKLRSVSVFSRNPTKNKFEIFGRVAQNSFWLLLLYFVAQYVLIIAQQFFCENIFYFFEKWLFLFDRSNMRIFTVNITRVVWPRVTNILDFRYFCQHRKSIEKDRKGHKYFF